ncbi:DMT family transporter [Arthrobacter sp. efr-133-TYG-120]|uniref:DMT family transporter n=1 Tax=Arthrobacter sp. efr-133-TYG-120 TaxID=3040280 RepID=UPI00254DD9D6|nr:DMT family transporter [Arthrobacter sp. efr-133-TYG-120]
MPQSSRPAIRSTSRPLLTGLLLAVANGTLLPVQGRINSALGAKLDDGVAAAVVSFTTGLVLIAVIGLALPKGRAGLRRIVPAVKERSFPRFYVVAGGIGALYVIAQSFTIGLLGVALFTVAVITGQTVSGLFVDRLGIGPGGKRSITGVRILGSILTIAAVAWAVSPRLGAAADVGSLLFPILLPVVAGCLMSFQQAMNGTATVHYGSPIAATLVNFVAGTVILWIAWLIKMSLLGPGHALPAEWWYYVGGPMGCVFIGLAALLVRSLGVLVTGLGMIAGQLLGSLALDLILPAPGTLVAFPTILGTLLTLFAIIVATLPWPKGALAPRRPAKRHSGQSRRQDSGQRPVG